MLRIAAVSGQPVPDAQDGARFANLLAPTVNELGQIAFYAELMGTGVNPANNQAIFSEGSGTLRMVARTGDEVFGSTQRGFNQLFTPTISNEGTVAFRAFLSGQGVDETDDDSIWAEAGDELVMLAREGQQAPGTPAGVLYGTFNVPLFNTLGRAAFHGGLVNPASPGGLDEGIWSQGAGDLALVARVADPAPGAGEGVLFSRVFAPVLNDAGQTAFLGYLTGPGVGTLNKRGIWAGNTGALSLVVRAGQPAPGTGEGVNFIRPYEPAINNAGRTAFIADLTGTGVDTYNNRGIWSNGFGEMRLVARKGDAAPGTAGLGLFSDLHHPVLNSTGATAFLGSVDGIFTAGFDGIWSEGSGSLELVARTGENAPGTPDGVIFEEFSQPQFNGLGLVSFMARLSGEGVSAVNERGIWSQNSRGELRLIVRAGQMLKVGQGDSRPVSDVFLVTGSGGEDGRQAGSNEYGELAFLARFLNSTKAIVTATLCESLSGDMDGNGTVEMTDAALLAAALVAPESLVDAEVQCAADVNNDGTVDGRDVSALVALLTTP